MKQSLLTILILHYSLFAIDVQALDMESYRKMGEGLGDVKKKVATSYAQSNGETRFKKDGEPEASGIKVSEALNFQGTDIKETQYNSGNMYQAAKEMADDPNNGYSSVVKDGFLRGKEFEVYNSDDFLNKARDVEANPEHYVDFLSGKYTDCQVKSEDITTKEEHRCDEYTLHQSHACHVGRKVEVNTKHKYICKKERQTYEKKCTKELKLKCKKTVGCDAGGIVGKEINISNVVWGYNYPNITLGTVHIFSNPGNCEKRTANAKFNIKNKSLIDEFRITLAKYSDWLRITVNGHQVYNSLGGDGPLFIVNEEMRKMLDQEWKKKNYNIAGLSFDQIGQLYWNMRKESKEVQALESAPYAVGGQFNTVGSGGATKTCNTKRFYTNQLNIDLRPYLREGENEMVVELLFGNRGQLYIEMITRQHCCDDWGDGRWEESCEVMNP